MAASIKAIIALAEIKDGKEASEHHFENTVDTRLLRHDNGALELHPADGEYPSDSDAGVLAVFRMR